METGGYTWNRRPNDVTSNTTRNKARRKPLWEPSTKDLTIRVHARYMSVIHSHGGMEKALGEALARGGKLEDLQVTSLGRRIETEHNLNLTLHIGNLS